MNPAFEIEICQPSNPGAGPPSCLPVGLDKSNLVDISCIGDSWRRYLNAQTGEVHDGAKYYAQATAKAT